MNKTKEQIDNFINRNLVEVFTVETFVKGEFTKTQTYEWEDENYKTIIEISTSRIDKKKGA